LTPARRSARALFILVGIAGEDIIDAHRQALGLGFRELAAVAKVSIDTVARFERGDELKERTIDALQRALEAAGVEFTNGDQPGVRLTKAAAGATHGARPSVKTGRFRKSSPR
jgi:transcriptional regulator with XRE-family HTH domain